MSEHHDSPLYNATLTERQEISPRLAVFRVLPDKGVFSFTPGQFAILGLCWSASRVPLADEDSYPPEKAERLIRRAYSISSGSREKRFVEYYISLVSDGALTPRLFDLSPGDRLFSGDKARGLFTLDKTPAEKNILLVSTGTGLAPYVSMVKTMVLGMGCPVHPITVVHGARYSWDLGYRAELEHLASQCPHFRYIPIITRPEKDPSWTGRTGRLTEWITSVDLEKECGFAPNPDYTHVFLCGHPGLISDGSALFEEIGFEAGTRKEPGNLHSEKYW
ncbi:ferredoxin--NADP reductase [Magnetococcales bacterium HHB-1]